MTLLERDREHEEIGLAKGRTEGLAKGLAKGREEGLAKGRTEGRTEERIRTLKTLMTNAHLSLDEAMQMIGVSASEKELYLPYLS